MRAAATTKGLGQPRGVRRGVRDRTDPTSGKRSRVCGALELHAQGTALQGHRSRKRGGGRLLKPQTSSCDSRKRPRPCGL